MEIVHITSMVKSMKTILKKSKEHLQENKMTYSEHFLFAYSHGVTCIIAGLCLIIHSIIPGVLASTGSQLVTKLNENFKKITHI
jgi:hypothetical protein